MRVVHLGLTNFRNYTRLELDLPEGIVLLQGDNAQGKTNLLEAICFLSHIHSPRVKTDRELVNWLVLQDNLPFARLVAQVQRGDETDQIELSLVQNNSGNHAPRSSGTEYQEDASGLRKHIRVNGSNKRAADAAGVISAVLFLPEDIHLVSGTPGSRRRYLDDVIGQIDPRYSHELQHYNRVLTRRNLLLKSFRGRAADPAQLVFWDQRLVEHGAYLTVRRQAAIAKLNALVQRIHPLLTADQEWLRLEYCSSALGAQPSVAFQMELPAALPTSQAESGLQDVMASFAAQLHEVQAKELEQGMSVIGPHRDDLRFLANGVDMNTYGSRGQQRTVALSLKLAEVEWLTLEKNDRPVLLLDDIMSELDAAHRGCVLQAIDRSQQVIITTTDAASFDPEFLAKATLWQVQAGRVSRLAL